MGQYGMAQVTRTPRPAQAELRRELDKTVMTSRKRCAEVELQPVALPLPNAIAAVMRNFRGVIRPNAKIDLLRSAGVRHSVRPSAHFGVRQFAMEYCHQRHPAELPHSSFGGTFFMFSDYGLVPPCVWPNCNGPDSVAVGEGGDPPADRPLAPLAPNQRIVRRPILRTAETPSLRKIICRPPRECRFSPRPLNRRAWQKAATPLVDTEGVIVASFRCVAKTLFRRTSG